MTTPAPSPPADPEPDLSRATRRLARWRKWVGAIVGLALLGAAIWAIASQPPELARSISAARRGPAWLIALALLLPLTNLVLASASFWAATRLYGRVAFIEMSALIAAAWLLNNLPFRPGMFGRIAYHKVFNGIALRDSVAVLVICLASTGIALLTLLFLAVLLGQASMAALGAALAFPAVAYAALAFARRGRKDSVLAITLLTRYLDALVWAARYAVLFALIGCPIGLPAAIAVGAVSQVAQLIPLAGNGLGIREWAVGLTISVLPPWFAPDSPETALGLTADLVNRAAELAVSIPLGLVAVRVISRRTAAYRAASGAPPAETRPLPES